RYAGCGPLAKDGKTTKACCERVRIRSSTARLGCGVNRGSLALGATSENPRTHGLQGGRQVQTRRKRLRVTRSQPRWSTPTLSTNSGSEWRREPSAGGRRLREGLASIQLESMPSEISPPGHLHVDRR